MPCLFMLHFMSLRYQGHAHLTCYEKMSNGSSPHFDDSKDDSKKEGLEQVLSPKSLGKQVGSGFPEIRKKGCSATVRLRPLSF